MNLEFFFDLSNAKKSQLTTLNLREVDLYKLTQEQWSILGKNLSKCIALVSLELGDVKDFKESKWHSLGAALAQCNTLISLSLTLGEVIFFTEGQWHAFGEVLTNCHTLESLNLRNSGLEKLTSTRAGTVGSSLVRASAFTLTVPTGLSSMNTTGNMYRAYFNSTLNPWYVTPWNSFIQAISQSNTLLNVACDDLRIERRQEIDAVFLQNTRRIKPKENAYSSSPIISETTTKIVEEKSAIKMTHSTTAASQDQEDETEPPSPVNTLSSALSLKSTEGHFSPTLDVISLKIGSEKTAQVDRDLVEEQSESLANFIDDSSIDSPPNSNFIATISSDTITQEEECIISSPVAIAIPILSRAEFETLMARVQSNERPEISLVSLEQTLFDLQQRISEANTQITDTFSQAERSVLQARISADQTTANLLIERRTLRSNAAHEAYYLAIQTYFSELMVASLGIGSGYVSVTNSQAATVVGWVCNAVSSIFPGASMATAAISAGANYLDTQYREAFLEKLKIFGTTITDAEVLGEQVARLLVRAHFHKKTALSKEHADKDAKALIMAIVQANPPISRDERTAERLFMAVWGNSIYCIDPLPAVMPTASVQVTASETFFTSSVKTTLSIKPLMPKMNSRTDGAEIESSAYEVNQLRRELEEKYDAIARLEEKQKAYEKELAEQLRREEERQERLAQLEARLQQTALKSEVPSKKDLAATQAEVAKLKSGNNGGGQMLMTRHEKMNGAETMEERVIALERRDAQKQEQLHHLTQQTLLNQENFERTPPSSGSQAYLMSRHGMLPPPISASVSAVNNSSFSSEKDELAPKTRKSLFGK